jgi:hypothetical protein
MAKPSSKQKGMSVNDNYSRLVKDNLERLYRTLPLDLAFRMGAQAEGTDFLFEAFGDPCRISAHGIELSGEVAPPILGILISLYALHADVAALHLLPFRSFKEFPGSMPYTGAFTTHSEQILMPYVAAIEESMDRLRHELNVETAPDGTGGDFSFVVRPLPKIALCYIFYRADEDFPASATCLFSQNADLFLPMDGLADVGEYTSKKIISIVVQ